MSGFDSNVVSSAALDLRRDDESTDMVLGIGDSEILPSEAMSKFRQFLRTHRDNDDNFVYRDMLKANYEQGEFYILVDMNDLGAFDNSLKDVVANHPARSLSFMEEAAKKVLVGLVSGLQVSDVPHIQVQLKNFQRFSDIRKLNAAMVSKLVCLRGIVVSAGRSRIKATSLTVMCKNCKATQKVQCSAGFGVARIPRVCPSSQNNLGAMEKCPMDPFQILADNSSYVDQQRLKLQEYPEEIPTGEMPRHITLSCDRYLVEGVKPGTRVVAIGIFTTYEANSAAKRESGNASAKLIRVPYVQVVGLQQDNEASDFLLGKFAPDDIEEMQKMSRMPGLYEQISKSVAPAIFGSEDIKRAVACQLFGGARKLLPDGMRLRGDVNVLLLGDPSVAKSQFLKFAVQVSPVGVYTSGKGSSAAGLTASVIRDPGTGEFHLEGGALVLADGGLVCIDEFDKMREQDRVAIHEAMEQQTISIAKAGITTILNSRTSVLAAANPVFGRYDDMKSPSDNIDFQTTILSRFDLIFIVRDVQNTKRDETLALHIINVHKNRDAALRGQQGDVAIEPEKLKKYIAYCRQKCKPRLSAEASELLKDRYVTFRNTMRAQKKESNNASAIPITVRQLEAIVRISESLARMEMSDVANAAHVKEALRLFKVSTFSAATSSYGDAVGSPEFMDNVRKAERFVEKRLPIGHSMSTRDLLRQMTTGSHSFGQNASLRALDIMVMRDKIRYKRQRKLVERMKA